jgi:NhaP-type Na+/H+ or K+/H+ antiporter
MAKALKMSDRSQAIVVIESALTDVICIVLTISFLDSLASGSLSLGAITVNMLFSLSVAAFFGFLTGVIWQHLLEPMRRIENSMFTSIAYCLCVYGLSEMLGLSGAISVLAFGFTSSNFPSSFTKRNYAHFTAVEKNFFNEIIFILKTFFFIYLGLSIKIDAIWVSIVAILILPPLFYLRLWVTKSTLPRDTSLADSSYMAFLIPKGLAAAVLAGLPAQYGTPNADGIQSFVYSIVLFSILMTATLIALSKTPAMTLYLQKFFGKPTENNVNPLTASAHSPFAVMATQDRPKIENGPDQKSEPS